MKQHLVLFTIALLLTAFTPKAKWQKLIDKDLSQWDMYLSFKIKNGYVGAPPTDENGKALLPIGYNQNVNNVWTVVREGGDWAIKATGEYYGCLMTKQSFENYHLKLKTKWGNKKWEPRLNELMDSGLLYHGRGECGVDYWRSWMLSQEFQIQEGCNGDYWNIANAQIEVKSIKKANGEYQANRQNGTFERFGAGTDKQGFCQRESDHEKPAGQWNTIELICFGDQSIHIVNGKVVMVLRNSAYWDGSKSIPMTSGQIALQSEACEVFFKDIMIKPISAMPSKYAQYFSDTP